MCFLFNIILFFSIFVERSMIFHTFIWLVLLNNDIYLMIWKNIILIIMIVLYIYVRT